MRIPAVITAAAPKQRHLLHQTLAREDSQLETVAQFALNLLMPEGQAPLVDRVAIVIPAGDSARFQDLIDQRQQPVTLIEQSQAGGYGQALCLARDFVGGAPFLHMVGDHFYMANEGPASGLAAALLETFEREGTSVSAVQPTRESLLPYFGAIGGTPQSSSGSLPLYRVQTVVEKPTPTEAEQHLIIPGLRAAHYLCFFGMHVFTPAFLEILGQQVKTQTGPFSISASLQTLAQQEPLLATILPGTRFDLGARYGILQAQLGLALRGPDREEILSMLLELMAR